MPEDKRRGTMPLSSVTGPYQGHETRYRLTQGVLQELEAVDYRGSVRILTKWHVVTREVEGLLRGVLDCELDRPRRVLSRDQGREVQGHVHARRHPGGGDDLAG